MPMPWRSVNLQDEGRRLKWGIMWEDGMWIVRSILDDERKTDLTSFWLSDV